MLSHRAIGLPALLTITLFINACGNNNASTSSAPAPTPNTSAATQPAALAPLTIKITDIRNKSGQLLFGVFTTADGFPSDSKKSVNWQSRPAESRDPDEARTTTFVCHLLPGTYGASVLHDENKNDKMDTRLGIPREGYGVTNNPKPRFRAAKFSESTFNLPPEGATLTISIQYF